MTLLEAMASLVILGASAVGFLGVFQQGARSVESAEAWNRATAAAESALEHAVDAHRHGLDPMAGAATGSARVEVRAWSATVDAVTVTVTLPDGRTLDVHRLVRRP